MTLDQRLRDELAAVAERVRPAPDPLGRLYARRRRNRRRAAVLAGACALIAVAAATLAFVPAGGDPPPQHTADDERGAANRRQWIRRLIDSPARGAVAANAAFVTQLTQAVTAAHRAGRFEIPPYLKTVKVLFVDDVGPVRVALAVFTDAPGGNPAWSSPSATWMLAPAGATAQTLAGTLNRDADPMNYQATGMDPFMTAELDIHVPNAGGTVSIGIAPADCEVATAALPIPATNWKPDWRPLPTRSYVARGPAQHRPEWWRVTCGGVVRAAAPAPFSGGAGNAGQITFSDADVDKAVANARGTVDREYARQELTSAATGWGYSVTARPIVIWAGDRPGPGPLDGKAIIMAAPAAGGGWAFLMAVTYDPPRPDGTGATGYGFTSDADVGNPAALIAFVYDEGPGGVFVVAPAGTATVRSLRAGREVARASVRDDAAVLPFSPDANLVVEALDANGTVTEHARLIKNVDPPHGIDAWRED